MNTALFFSEKNKCAVLERSLVSSVYMSHKNKRWNHDSLHFFFGRTLSTIFENSFTIVQNPIPSGVLLRVGIYLLYLS